MLVIVSKNAARELFTAMPTSDLLNTLVQHVELYTLHLLKQSSESSSSEMALNLNVFICGRQMSDKYTLLHSAPYFPYPKCKIRFGIAAAVRSL